jgi:hypothetical protein
MGRPGSYIDVNERTYARNFRPAVSQEYQPRHRATADYAWAQLNDVTIYRQMLHVPAARRLSDSGDICSKPEHQRPVAIEVSAGYVLASSAFDNQLNKERIIKGLLA